MVTTPMRNVLSHLRVAAVGHDKAGDGELLERFVTERDPAVFATLVRRHGPMVLGVCRRVTGNVHDAEDAFQAAFLVLARKAATVRAGGGLANWLYGVAYRTALKARSQTARRRAREVQVAVLPDRESPQHPLGDDVLRQLDEELTRLPDIYRTAVVLCDLEGLTQREAARRASCPEGTLSARLTRARTLLARRLTRRGVTLTAGGVAAALGQGRGVAAVPAALVRSTAQAACAGAAVTGTVAALAEGVMKSMLLCKLKNLAAGAALLGGLVAAVALGLNGPAAGKNDPRSPESSRPAGPPLPEGAVIRLGGNERQTAGDRFAVSADGKSIIGIRGDRYVRVWDLQTGRLRESRELPVRYTSVSVLSDDGRLLATDGGTYAAGRLVVWDVERGKRLWERPLRGGRRVPKVTFSADGRRVAAIGSEDDVHAVRVWDVGYGKEVFTSEVKTPSSSRPPVFTPDGKRLLASFTSAEEGTRCWDLTDGGLVWQNKSFCPDGMLVTADGHVYPDNPEVFPLLDAGTGKEMGKALEGWGGGALRLLPDGKRAVVAGPEAVTIWDLARGKKLRDLPVVAKRLAFTPDGRGLVTDNGRLQRWDLDTGRAAYPEDDQGHVGEVMALSFAGGRLVSAGQDHTVRVWDLATGKPVSVWRKGDARRPLPYTATRVVPGALDVSPDGRWALLPGQDLALWDVKEGKLVHDLQEVPRAFQGPGFAGPATVTCRVSPDGSRVVALIGEEGFGGAFVVGGQPPPLTARGRVVTWEASSGKQLSRYDVEFSGRGVMLSPDGRWLLDDGALTPTTSGTRGHRLEGVPGKTVSLPYAFSPDGILVVGGASRTEVRNGTTWALNDGVKVWETATGKLIAHLKVALPVGQFCFHPAGRLLAVNGLEDVKVWDLQTGRMVCAVAMPEKVNSVAGRGCYAGCIALSPDGQRLATGLPDGTILVWRVPSPREAPAGRLGQEELAGLWADLDREDAARAWRAVRRLSASPEEAVRFLRERVEPVRPAPAESTRALIADLDRRDFQKREAATRRLRELGVRAEGQLREALKANPPAEQRRRIEELLDRVQGLPPLSSEDTRGLRAVAVLRLAGTAEATRLLKELAGGVERARLTVEARAALQAFEAR